MKTQSYYHCYHYYYLNGFDVPIYRKCKPCPSSKQSFVCGSDNRTYSSACRLDYHNCVHNSPVKVSCKGFCPCKGNYFYSIVSKECEKNMDV